MTQYELSKDAQTDLQEVARYTIKHWGKQQFNLYRQGLKETFHAIGNGSVAERQFSESLPQLRVIKYRHHYIFYIKNDESRPIIIGVIHERRDVVNQLAKRLG